MSLSLGLVGLPNAGKSTLFNALARGAAAVAPYPFTTIEPNLGQAIVPDDRLTTVAAVIRPARVVPAIIRFIDIAGLVRGASKGEGLGNQFLAYIREVDAIVHVVRCFGDAADGGPQGGSTEGALDPVRDAEVVETELALADLEAVERAREKAASRAKAGETAAREQVTVLQDLAAGLSRGIPARQIHGAAGAAPLELRLLTAMPIIYVANVDEASLPEGGPPAAALRALADREGAACAVLSAKLEAELGELSAEDAKAYLAAAGLAEPGVLQLIRASFTLLGLVSFFTVLSDEVRAWPVPRGTTALAAAGQIHTDMARGFIRAEVITWDALVAAGSIQAARNHGAIRLEGRDYVVADGDVITFRFAV